MGLLLFVLMIHFIMALKGIKLMSVFASLGHKLVLMGLEPRFYTTCCISQSVFWRSCFHLFICDMCQFSLCGGFHRQAQFESQTQILRQAGSSLKYVNKGSNMAARDSKELNPSIHAISSPKTKHIMQNVCFDTSLNSKNKSFLFKEINRNIKNAMFAIGQFTIKKLSKNVSFQGLRAI